jgi:hypothetical protein
LTAELESTPAAFVFTIPVPNPDKVIFPVVALPKVRDCFAVVARVPSAVIYILPLVPALTEAVGVPLLTPRTANFALDEVAPPTSKSEERLTGERAPLIRFHFEAPDPDPGQADHTGAPAPPDVRHSPPDPAAKCPYVVVPVE